MTPIFYGLIGIVTGFVFIWLYETIKALKDPDVQEASKLRISITRYRKYQEAEKKIKDIYSIYGTNSREATEKVGKIILSLPNLNEWRRYSKYQYEKSAKEMMDEINKLK